MRKSMNIELLKNEKGFWSAFVLILVITLSLMGMGAYVLMRSEGANVANRVQVLQAEYAANGAAYYGIRRLEIGAIAESHIHSIGGGQVTIDTTNSGSTIHLTVTSTAEGIQRVLRLDLTSTLLEDMAIWTTGTVTDVDVYDSTGTIDNSLMIDEADSLPSMDTSSLIALATSQGQAHSGSFSPPDGYPSSSFYNSGTTPNVTYIDGDLIVDNGRTVYGIFYVTGNVEVRSSFTGGIGRIEGIVYLPSQSSTITMSMEGLTSVNGGVISGGNIDGSGWLDGKIQHCPEYMRGFSQFQDDPGSGGSLRILDWVYE
jgi:hypothetical protein